MCASVNDSLKTGCFIAHKLCKSCQPLSGTFAGYLFGLFSVLQWSSPECVVSRGSQFKTNPLLTFAAVHSSSAITTPSMISIPASPPDLPAACNSFKTMRFNFSLWTSSSRPLPCILLSAASFFSAGSAGTMIAMGLARSVAACTQMLATTVAER